MARYVDGYVLPIPRKHVETYRKIAQAAGRIWREHGALSYTESMGDDVKPGKLTSFPQAVKLRKGEVVWLSWAMYKNRAHRDRVNKKVLADPRLEAMAKEPFPFDMKRMVMGGFDVIVDL